MKWTQPGFQDKGELNVNMVGLVIQLISGAVGGNIAGAILKKYNLGPIGNSIVGLIGGPLGGQLLGMLTAGGAAAAGAPAGGLDLSSILSSVAGGGVGGGVLMAIVGMVKAQMGKSST